MKEIRGRIRSMLGKILIAISGVLLFTTVGLVIVQKASPQELPTTSGTPISWASNQLDVVMFPGTSTSTKVSFRSSQSLTSVGVNLTPSLVDIASVTPKIFYNIQANQDYIVTLTIKAPPEFTKRSFGGSLHLTNSQSVISQPLQVGMKTDYQTFSDNTLGIINLSYPQGWYLWKDKAGIAFSNVQHQSELSDAAMQKESRFSILSRIGVNPQRLPIDQWFADYIKGGYSVPPMNLHLISVDGQQSVYIEVSEIGKNVHLFIPHGSDILEIIYGLYAPTFIGTYESIERSIQF